MISLRLSDARNWYTCCHLALSEQQQAYMEQNAISLLQAMYEPTLRPRAIYGEETMIDFLMYNTEPEELDALWIYRILIDYAHQDKGIDRQATRLMLEEIGEGKSIVGGYHPVNKAAHHLNESLGFVDEGHRFGREMALFRLM